ncbi:hypothetical protein KC19_11G004400 [Ceratodon purpureus]|uniref:Uncharacterized protein n=1 Tax=Ceratodon purpureus TaxID=3225 RepID=A0A8T0GBU9_CERPU|nr:hypothetical protein KC19_11G004400 [Ceratodon purpureus]
MHHNHTHTHTHTQGKIISISISILGALNHLYHNSKSRVQPPQPPRKEGREGRPNPLVFVLLSAVSSVFYMWASHPVLCLCRAVNWGFGGYVSACVRACVRD